MASENGKGWVILGKLLSDGNISEEHKLFNHKMRVNVQVFGYIGRVLGFIVKFKLELWRCESESTGSNTTVSEYPRNLKQAP
jgi:hypothetical protein